MNNSIEFLVSSLSLFNSMYLDPCFGVCFSSLFWLSSFVSCGGCFFVFLGYVVVFSINPSFLLFSGASGELVSGDRRLWTVCGSLLMFFPFFGVFCFVVWLSLVSVSLFSLFPFVFATSAALLCIFLFFFLFFVDILCL